MVQINWSEAEGPDRTGRSAVSWPVARAVRTLGLSLALMLGGGTAVAENDGITTALMEDGISSCSGTAGCHFNSDTGFPGSPTPGVNVTITGLDTLFVDETQTYTISVSPGDFGGSITGTGVHVAAFLDDLLTDDGAGILDESDSKTKITTSPSGQMTHVNATGMSVGVYSYDFTVTAPKVPGELRLEGALNGFDGVGGSFGEEWNSATKTIMVLPEPTARMMQPLALAALLVLRASRRKRR